MPYSGQQAYMLEVAYMPGGQVLPIRTVQGKGIGVGEGVEDTEGEIEDEAVLLRVELSIMLACAAVTKSESEYHQ